MFSFPLVNPIGSRATCQTVFRFDVSNPTSFGRKPETGLRFFLNLTIRWHSNSLDLNFSLRSETLAPLECCTFEERQLWRAALQKTKAAAKVRSGLGSDMLCIRFERPVCAEFRAWAFSVP